MKLPAGVTVLDDPDELLVHAVAPQRMTVEEAEEEAAAAEAAAPGEPAIEGVGAKEEEEKEP